MRKSCSLAHSLAACWLCLAGAVHLAQADPVPAIVQQIDIPDVTLLDQNGRQFRFYPGMLRNHVFAINTIFTTCTTICPLMGVNFSKLAKQLGPSAAGRLQLISISVDPVNDTPARLKQWAKRFQAGPEWTLLTGPKAEVERLLKPLGLYTPEKLSHSFNMLVGGEAGWTRTNALAPLPELTTLIRSKMSELSATPPAEKYFTNTLLTDQDGVKLRFYSDLLKGKVVVVNNFFTTCKDSCPMMANNMEAIQDYFHDRLGKDLYLLSLTVAPVTDTPARMKDYATKMHARPGWFFLTGTKEEMDSVLLKLGQRINQREDHTNLFFIGNDRTGLWKKAMGMASKQELIGIVQSVLNDGK